MRRPGRWALVTKPLLAVFFKRWFAHASTGLLGIGPDTMVDGLPQALIHASVSRIVMHWSRHHGWRFTASVYSRMRRPGRWALVTTTWLADCKRSFTHASTGLLGISHDTMVNGLPQALIHACTDRIVGQWSGHHGWRFTASVYSYMRRPGCSALVTTPLLAVYRKRLFKLASTGSLGTGHDTVINGLL